MWIAKPWRRYELPAPHTVYKPSMKSVGESGTSTGFHRSWVGVAELFDRSNSLTSFPWPGILGLNGSWVTDGFTRYNQLLAPQKKKIKKNLQWKSKWIREDNNYKQLIIAYIEHTHTIWPALVVLAGRGEGGAGDLLGVEAEGADEGAVLAVGKSPGDGLRREVVTEAREVDQLGRERQARRHGLSFRHCWWKRGSGRGRDVWEI